MKLFSAILPTLLAFANAQNDYGLDAVTSQKICMGNANFDRIQECTEYARSKMPTPEEANEAITHVEEPFNLWDYTRGYSNDKVLVFECLGWISDEDGRINVDAIKEFMSTTAVASYFEGDMGDENLSSCAVQSETMTVNDFFNGIEPNNQVPCDCEGDVCLDDQGDDEEAKAESRFSLQSLVKGKPEKIAKQLIKRIHDEIMENDEEAEEQVFEEEELEALEEVQDEEGKRRRGQRKEKKQRRKNNKKARKNKRQGERTHSHIHIPAGQDKSEDIDIVKEFHKMSEVDEAKIMLLLQPIAFIRCVMTDFNEACGMYIDETTRQALGEL